MGTQRTRALLKVRRKHTYIYAQSREAGVRVVSFSWVRVALIWIPPTSLRPRMRRRGDKEREGERERRRVEKIICRNGFSSMRKYYCNLSHKVLLGGSVPLDSRERTSILVLEPILAQLHLPNLPSFSLLSLSSLPFPPLFSLPSRSLPLSSQEQGHHLLSLTVSSMSTSKRSTFMKFRYAK